ncbi:uncharacterized protein LOC141972715 [Athene noctua]|uniref:uncharacterized protein LOC141972715 n=1 Tax=Athene noctua TaxID=126797 RepID=UPI003EBAA7F9
MVVPVRDHASLRLIPAIRLFKAPIQGNLQKPHVLLKTAGLQRTSVFDRLGAEAKADTATGGKPVGVFSRLGDALGTDGDKASESDDDCSVLQYAGVLKKLAKPPPKESAEPGGTVKAEATSSEAKPVPVTAATQRPGRRNAAGSRTATKPSPAASKIPRLFTRVMGKVYIQFLMSRPDEENITIYLQLLEQCLSHEAFTETQKRRLRSWWWQVQRLLRSFSLGARRQLAPGPARPPPGASPPRHGPGDQPHA